MPKTRFQGIVFGLMMVTCMVYPMTCYNITLATGRLSAAVLKTAVIGAIPGIIIAFILENLIAGRLAKMLAFRFVTPGKDKPIYIIFTISICTVCLMCPLMSFTMNLIHSGLSYELFFIWLKAIAFCFPFALGWQLFVAGPVVRFVFSRIFPANITQA